MGQVGNSVRLGLSVGQPIAIDINENGSSGAAPAEATYFYRGDMQVEQKTEQDLSFIQSIHNRTSLVTSR